MFKAGVAKVNVAKVTRYLEGCVYAADRIQMSKGTHLMMRHPSHIKTVATNLGFDCRLGVDQYHTNCALKWVGS